jgi:hypothetical protein
MHHAYEKCLARRYTNPEEFNTTDTKNLAEDHEKQNSTKSSQGRYKFSVSFYDDHAFKKSIRAFVAITLLITFAARSWINHPPTSRLSEVPCVGFCG